MLLILHICLAQRGADLARDRLIIFFLPSDLLYQIRILQPLFLLPSQILLLPISCL